MPVHTHEALGITLSGVIAINNGQGIAMPHGREDMQQIRTQA
jgi:hypothetical protein